LRDEVPTSQAADEPLTLTEPAPIQEKAPKSAGIVNLSEGSERCQAATVKGTQCKRESGLTTMDRTIDKKRYRFLVCNQHKNQSFKPFADLMH